MGAGNLDVKVLLRRMRDASARLTGAADWREAAQLIGGGLERRAIEADFRDSIVIG